MIACPNCGFSTDADPHLGDLDAANTDPRQQLADLDSEIARVTALLRQLRQKRTPLKREINAHSTVLRLPPEILSEIFVTYLATNGVDFVHQSWMRLTITNSPLLFGRVCRAWREIAWSTPSLWCSMRLPNLQKKKLDFVLVDGWLKRSGSLPLSICAALPSDNSSPIIVAIMDVIAKYSERWQNVHFELPLHCYDVLKRVKSRLPILHYIGIEKEPWAEVALHLDMFSVAPLLRHLYMRGINLYDFDLPTDQVTKLTLECDFVNEFLYLLRYSPQVVHCLVVGISIPSPRDQLHHALASKLENLEISFDQDYNGPISDILDALTLPAVRAFSCIAVEIDFPHLSFISLISRSSCSLQSLCLESCKTSDSEFVDCLRAIPSLQKLLLTEVTLTHEILRLLTPCYISDANPSQDLLPNLTTFEFMGPVDTFKLDMNVLLNWLRSRRVNGRSMLSNNERSHLAQLQSVKFNAVDSEAPDAYALAQLQHLVNDGMEIVLETSAGKLSRPSFSVP
jgi:F-box-like